MPPYGLAKLLNRITKESSEWSPIEKLNGKEARKTIDAILAILDAYKPDINYRNKEGETALFLAARAGNNLMIDFFIQQGADINLQGKEGMTPLMLAITTQPKNESLAGAGSREITDPKTNKKERHSSRSDFVKALLEKGADLTLRNNAGKTALDLARENGNEEILSLLEKATGTRKASN